MAVTFQSVGTPSAVTPNPTPSYPISIALGDLLVLLVVNKYPTNGPSTPSGWTLWGQSSGGAGAAGADSGTVYATVFYKIADGTETGAITVTIASSNSSRAQIGRWTKGATESWGLSVPSIGSSNTPGTAVNVTGDVDPGAIAGDLFIVLGGANTNLYTLNLLPTLAISGCSISNPGGAFMESGGGSGDHVRIFASNHAVMSGTSAGVPSYAASYSGTAGNAPAGGAVIVRARAVPTIASSITGNTGTLTGTPRGAGVLASAIAGNTGTLAGLLKGSGALVASLSGSGACSGTVTGSGALVSALSGMGTCTSTPTIHGGIGGSCTITGTLAGAGSLSAALAGTCFFSALDFGGINVVARQTSVVVGSANAVAPVAPGISATEAALGVS